MKFLALDYEGSHKHPHLGCPLQLGIALMDGSEVLDSAEWLIKQPRHWKTGKPTKEIDANALAISGLTLERIEREGVTSAQSCHMLNEFVTRNSAKSLPVVAFNAVYDLACYRDMLFSGGDWHPTIKGTRVSYPEILSAKWICAMATARHMLRLDTYSLDAVSESFGLEREGESHGALEDAVLAGTCYSLMVHPARAVAA